MGKKGKKKVDNNNTQLDVALLEKKAGNEEYLKGNHSKAVEHYTAAIAISVRNLSLLAVLFVNRATAFIRLKVYFSHVSLTISLNLLCTEHIHKTTYTTYNTTNNIIQHSPHNTTQNTEHKHTTHTTNATQHHMLLTIIIISLL
jgi:hypothetical protein